MMEFDEAHYLEKNPDVAAAVRNGEWPSGFMHYCVTGKSRGRLAAPPVDVEWYIYAYPRAAFEIAKGDLANATEHYHRVGKYRGYLPSAGAPRPANAAVARSQFGGLWSDAANALDVIAGRLDVGLLNEEQADLLKRWVTDGYVLLPEAIPAAVLDAADAEIDRAYQGAFSELLFDLQEGGESMAGTAEVLERPARALDLHWFSTSMLQLILAPDVMALLHLLFERRVLVSRSWACRSAGPPFLQQESAITGYSLPLQSARAWIALQDTKEVAGARFLYPGSHRLAEFCYGESKSMEEARRLKPQTDFNKMQQRHRELLERQAKGVGIAKKFLATRRGDVVVTCADLIQGTLPSHGSASQKGVTAAYCPMEVAPNYFESQGRGTLKSFGSAFYSSAYYA